MRGYVAPRPENRLLRRGRRGGKEITDAHFEILAQLDQVVGRHVHRAGLIGHVTCSRSMPMALARSPSLSPMARRLPLIRRPTWRSTTITAALAYPMRQQRLPDTVRVPPHVNFPLAIR